MNIAIIDDDSANRKLLKSLVETENIGKVVFEHENGTYIDELDFSSTHIDIILTDLILPVRSGLLALRDLQRKNFNGSVIILSQVQDKNSIGEAFSLGIEYFINKPINLIEITSIFNKVKEKHQLQQALKELQRERLQSQLTPTEIAILRLVSKRLTQAEIAKKQSITLQTVKNHINKILKKTSSFNSKEAARKAKEMGLI